MDITCSEEQLISALRQNLQLTWPPRGAAHLVHLLQTLVSDLQPFQNLLLYLSELQILDL